MKSFPAFGILLKSPSERKALFSLLEENSGLPGPRANLELGYSFARAVASLKPKEWQWEMVLSMASLPQAQAPQNSRKEYIPFCGVLALGSLYAAGLPRPRKRAALAAIRAAASDPRWRTREASAMALQLIGEADREALREIAQQWLAEASLLEKRAIVAGLAHPPILGDKPFVLFCLELTASILKSLAFADAVERRSAGFRVLRQGLGYAISVFVEKTPAEGFALLREAASSPDADLRWIVRENLKKKRLSSRYPGEAQVVANLLPGK